MNFTCLHRILFKGTLQGEQNITEQNKYEQQEYLKKNWKKISLGGIMKIEMLKTLLISLVRI